MSFLARLLLFTVLLYLCKSECPIVTGYESIEEFQSIRGISSKPGVKVELTTALNKHGAACLDGSPGVFYFRKGSESHKFHVFLEGGGACAGIEEPLIECMDSCAARAGTGLGSSTSYPKVLDFDDGGYLSTDSDINPLTHNWNTVYLRYCDGSCYSSNNHTVHRVNDSLSLHFTGFKILDGLFDELKEHHGFEHATDLLLSGCSAGGVGTYLHMDYISKHKLPKKTRMAAMPDSGFILEYQGKGKLMTAMQWIYHNMNTTASLNGDCVAAQEPENEYLCMFAQRSTPYSTVDTLGLQSQYDSWQDGCMLMSENPKEINQYGRNLTSTIFEKYLIGPHHAMFLDSCHHHCGEWDQIRIDGALASDAQYAWYYQTTNQTYLFQNHTYPCLECCKP